MLALFAVSPQALVVSRSPVAPTTSVVRSRATVPEMAGGKGMDILRAKTKEERRLLKLEVGTNWRPRTTPDQWDQKGYFFFQGPSPKTSVQKDLPSFFSPDNFANLEVSLAQVLVTLTGLASFAVISTIVLTGGLDIGGAPAPATKEAKAPEKKAPPPAPAAKAPPAPAVICMKLSRSFK